MSGSVFCASILFPHPSNTTFELIHLEVFVALHTKPTIFRFLSERCRLLVKPVGARAFQAGHALLAAIQQAPKAEFTG